MSTQPLVSAARLSTRRIVRRIKFPPGPLPTATVLGKSNVKPYTFQQVPGRNVFIGKEVIYVGRDKWSQVYRGSLRSLPTRRDKFATAGKIKESETQSINDVVLKIYDTSLFPGQASMINMALSKNDQEWADRWRYEFNFTDEHMCWSEVFAYSKLGPIQGKIVPKFIDAFMVKSPKITKGENMAIAMSYVKGGSVTEMCQELGSDKDPDPGLWYPIGLEMIRAVYAVHQQGVAGFHVRDANMLVEKLDPPVSANDSDSCQSHSRYAIKIIDFACASSCDYAHSDGGPIGDQQEAINDVDDLALLIGEICGTLDPIPVGSDIYGACRRRSEFLKWVKKNHGQERCVQAFWPALETSTYDDYTPWIKTDNMLRSLRSKGSV